MREWVDTDGDGLIRRSEFVRVFKGMSQLADLAAA
jgi:hypothetical protein